MGVVYRAERADAAFRRHAALKVVRPGPDSPQIVERFQLERETLAALDHPNIARLMDGGTTADGQPFFVMELVDGEPIDRYCDEHRLSIDERLDLFRKVCAGVQYAHENLVVHRDIKPDNILVTKDGVPKLLDFGVAKILSRDGAPRRGPGGRRRPRGSMTPDYASPEQVSGRPSTTATDVYSLGVLLHVLLTGARPYTLTGTTPAAIEKQLLEFTLIPPSERAVSSPESERAAPPAAAPPRSSWPGGCTGDLDAIVLRALGRTAVVALFERGAAGRGRGPAPRPPSGARPRTHRRLRHAAVRAAAPRARLPWRRLLAGARRRRHRGRAVAGLAGRRRAAPRRAALQRRARAGRLVHLRRLRRHRRRAGHDAGAAADRAARGAVSREPGARGRRATPACSASWRAPSSASATCRGTRRAPTSAIRPGAIASYQRAIALAEAVRAEAPGDVEALRTLALAHRQRGDVLALTGDKAKALADAETSADAVRAGGRPGRRHARRSRGRGRGRRSSSAICWAIRTSRTSGAPAAPTSPTRRRSTTFRQLDRAAPTDVRVRRYLGVDARAHRHHARRREAVDRRRDGVSGVVRDSPRPRRARADASRHPARPRHRPREAGQRAAGAVERGGGRGRTAPGAGGLRAAGRRRPHRRRTRRVPWPSAARTWAMPCAKSGSVTEALDLYRKALDAHRGFIGRRTPGTCGPPATRRACRETARRRAGRGRGAGRLRRLAREPAAPGSAGAGGTAACAAPERADARDAEARALLSDGSPGGRRRRGDAAPGAGVGGRRRRAGHPVRRALPRAAPAGRSARCAPSAPTTRCSRPRSCTRRFSGWPAIRAGSRAARTSSAWRPSAMRRVLVDHARGRNAQKRGQRRDAGHRGRLSTTCRSRRPRTSISSCSTTRCRGSAALDARQGQIVELRFFGGLSVEETAAVVGVSERTIKREWQMSRAWLRREMSRTCR